MPTLSIICMPPGNFLLGNDAILNTAILKLSCRLSANSYFKNIYQYFSRFLKISPIVETEMTAQFVQVSLVCSSFIGGISPKYF
jgi:hypothetical protein